MKQTVVDFLYEFVLLQLTYKQQAQFEGLFQQAKEMEKEQLCYFYTKGAEAELNNPYVTNIEFYNKYFKSHEK